MTCDWDGRIRMDCSSPYAMASMIANKDHYDVAFAADTDHDRHGIVTRTAGLLNPNHYLAVCIQYLFTHRPNWDQNVGIGKTLVSSSIIDRVAKGLDRHMLEVPVGFKWFVDDLIDGTLGFAGEESAGATFLRSNGQVWTTDKDGLIPGLLAAEMTARDGQRPRSSLRRSHPKIRRPDLPAHRRRRHPRPEGQAGQTLAPDKSPRKPSRANPLPPFSQELPATTQPWAD